MARSGDAPGRLLDNLWPYLLVIGQAVIAGRRGANQATKPIARAAMQTPSQRTTATPTVTLASVG